MRLRPTRTIGMLACGLLVLAATTIAFETGPALGESPRKTARHSTPARIGHAAPDTTAGIPSPGAAPRRAAPPPPPPADDGVIPPPFTLPAASRARTRACGETWRDMKTAGTTGDGDWRDFAMKCLSATAPPPRSAAR